MPRANFSAAAGMGMFAAFCLAGGAMLDAVARGVENGQAGTLGFQLEDDMCSGERVECTLSGCCDAPGEKCYSGDFVNGHVTYARCAVNCEVEGDLTCLEHTPGTQFLQRFYSDAQISLRWSRRRDAQPYMLMGHVVSISGWFLALPAVSSFAQILGGPERSASGLLQLSFLTAAILTVVEFTSDAGTAAASDWMSTWPLLSRQASDGGDGDDDSISALQSLEVSYIMSHSRTLWLFAVKGIMLAAALLASAFLICASSHLGAYAGPARKGHAAVSVLAALVCVIDFSFAVSRYWQWREFNNAAIVCTLLIEAILLPVWLLWITLVLRRISQQGGQYMSAFQTFQST